MGTPRWSNKVSPTGSGPWTEAAGVLKAGGVAVVPTDTVYGLAGLLDNEAAVERIFQIKGRPAGKGLIAMIADYDEIERFCASVPTAAAALAARFWPGPLTLVLQARENVPTNVLVRGKIGIRLPDHGVLRDLIRAVGGPLAVTSANLSGRPSPVDVAQCREELGDKVDLIVDGGRSPLGVESTVIDVSTRPPKILREGAVSGASIMEVLHRDER